MLLRGVVAVVGFLALGFVVSLEIRPFEINSFEAIRSSWRSSDAWLLDRNGEPLSRIRIDKERRRGDWVALADVSPALVEEMLAAEDRRFRGHGGVDWPGMAGALRETTSGGRRGGSTVTMQLAAWLHPELERSGRRGAWQKWLQLRQAIAMEKHWTKDELLEAWLNLTPFRGELEGIDAASRTLFGKRPSGLDRSESALLAALVRAPNASPQRVAQRACALLERDADAGAGVCDAVNALAADGLRARAPRAASLDGDAPHLARKLLAAPGVRERSTLDARVQRFAADTLERHLRELEGRNVEDGAAVVLDNATGEVLAWIGSGGHGSSAAQVDGVLARRQPGSTLKPFLYALAIERRLLTAASVLDDSSVAITTPSGLYVPQNYDHSFRGRVSLRTALAGSLNVPAVRTLALLGYEPFYLRLRALGFDSLTRDADHYGYALALGGSEVTLLELTNAYRVLANGGGFTAPKLSFISFSSEAKQVLDPRAAYVIGDILADAAARATTFGLANPLATRYPASVKTGTSTDMRDNWAVGFSSRYTVGVWVGNFSGEPMHDVSGVTGAAPVWRDLMDFLHEGDLPPPPAAPGGLVRRGVAYAGDIEPRRDEWFIAGTESSLVTAVEVPAGQPRIVSPANGAVLALDPDIPAKRQRVAVRVAGAHPGARLRIDDGIPVPAGEPQLWLPTPGRHVLRLVDAGGAELDLVKVTVRGIRYKSHVW
jgi:penicillin-binding protein 1C